MRIALIGAANSVHTVKWANGLKRLGHFVDVITLRPHYKTDGYDDEIKILTVPSINKSGYFTGARTLKKILKAGVYDVTGAHYASGYGTLARFAGAAPCVLSVWGSDIYEFPYSGLFANKLMKNNLSYFKTLCSTSHIMKDKILEFSPHPNVKVIPFGVDTNLFAPPTEISDDDNVFKIGIIKTISPKYGITYLIEAFDIFLRNYNKPATLKIYGAGIKSEIKRLKDLIEKLKLETAVELCGYIPNTDVPKILQNLNLCVFSSIFDSESFGVAAVEAMACGLPVLATDVDGFKEVVDDGVTGFIVPRQNPDAMAQKMTELANNPKLRKTMGKQGRQKVLQLYDINNNVAEYEKVLIDAAQTNTR